MVNFFFLNLYMLSYYFLSKIRLFVGKKYIFKKEIFFFVLKFNFNYDIDYVGFVIQRLFCVDNKYLLEYLFLNIQKICLLVMKFGWKLNIQLGIFFYF